MFSIIIQTYSHFKIIEYTIKLVIEEPATFISGNFYRKYGPIDENLHLAMDLDLWMKFLLTNTIDNTSKIDDIIVNYREHEDSKTVNHREQMVVERAKVLQEVIHSCQTKKGRYQILAQELREDQTKEIVAGCIDFQLFWYSRFKKENHPLKASLKALIDKNNIGIKNKLKLLLS